MNPYLSDMRNMRARLRGALSRGLVAVLDVGTSKTVCFVLRVDQQRLDGASSVHETQSALRVVGAGVTRSRGVRLGEIVDLEEAQRAIRTALELAEKMAGVRVDQVIAAVSGAKPVSFASFGEAEVDADEVDQRDVARALHDDRIALADVFFFYVVGVVQRCI